MRLYVCLGYKQRHCLELQQALCLTKSIRHTQGGISVRGEDEDEDEAAIERQYTPEELAEIHEMKNDRELYANLVKSIAPAVYGMRRERERERERECVCVCVCANTTPTIGCTRP
jgi:hypothetical protein